MFYLKIDDPVSCIPVHFFCSVWGLLVVGLVGEKETVENVNRSDGVLKGGPASFLAYQLLATACIIIWAGVTSAIEVMCFFLSSST